MTPTGTIPTPSDAVLIRLASIAVHTDVLLVADSPRNQASVGLNTIKNDRRRTMEAILALLADPEVSSYLAELERLGLLPIK